MQPKQASKIKKYFYYKHYQVFYHLKHGAEWITLKTPVVFYYGDQLQDS